jgi:flavin-dependent dehydrogenase
VSYAVSRNIGFVVDVFYTPLWVQRSPGAPTTNDGLFNVRGLVSYPSIRMRAIKIAGGGPAGSAAGIAALNGGASVRIVEKSRHPQHKVCGEFLAAETCQVLEELGAWDEFQRLKPARIVRCSLHFGSCVKEWKLAEPAFGLSRLRLDELLLDRAAALGADVVRGERFDDLRTATIVITGRRGVAPRGARLFAFKSHFEGPASDAVEVFFDRAGYVGVSPVEAGVTNVCGIVPETILRGYGFEFDEILFSRAGLAERLRPLSRRMPWLATGPLVFSKAGRGDPAQAFHAGDAMGFVDPFTGSGILNALLTGRLAGSAVARGLAPHAYRDACRAMLRRPFAVSAIFRALVRWGWAEYLVPFVPGQWLYRMTRVGRR